MNQQIWLLRPLWSRFLRCALMRTRVRTCTNTHNMRTWYAPKPPDLPFSKEGGGGAPHAHLAVSTQRCARPAGINSAIASAVSCTHARVRAGWAGYKQT